MSAEMQNVVSDEFTKSVESSKKQPSIVVDYQQAPLRDPMELYRKCFKI